MVYKYTNINITKNKSTRGTKDPMHENQANLAKIFIENESCWFSGNSLFLQERPC